MLVGASSLLALLSYTVARSSETQSCTTASSSGGALCSGAMSTNQTFLSPTDGGLPEGTYLATGLAGIAALAAYLDAHPETRVTRLLLSDSTVEDMDTGFGFIPYRDHALFESGYGSRPLRLLTDEEEDHQEEIRHHNVKASFKRWRTIRDITAPLTRVLDHVSPSLEALSYVLFLQAHLGEEDWRMSVLDRDFPSLQYLTLRSGGHRDEADFFSLKKFASRAPGLTHLHVVREHIASLAALRDSFPSLTDVRITGSTSMSGLPGELDPQRPVPSWGETVRHYVSGARPPDPPVIIPGNLTVIVQPGFDPMFHGGWCGTPGVEYGEIFERLATEPVVHLLFPIEEDYRKYSSEHGLFPVGRAMVEFENLARGGEGDWAETQTVGEDAYWWRSIKPHEPNFAEVTDEL
ncbi:hypothetical protein B0H10DRAFT_2071086 [Mycena sp. CBHHK59/15]|nr:hypothetical protein B0H10DRAFT_2071086 [Mycena sp. CBHHK59/15]